MLKKRGAYPPSSAHCVRRRNLTWPLPLRRALNARMILSYQEHPNKSPYLIYTMSVSSEVLKLVFEWTSTTFLFGFYQSLHLACLDYGQYNFAEHYSFEFSPILYYSQAKNQHGGLLLDKLLPAALSSQQYLTVLIFLDISFLNHDNALLIPTLNKSKS